MERWKGNTEERINLEYVREHRLEDEAVEDREVATISEDEMQDEEWKSSWFWHHTCGAMEELRRV